MMSGPYNWEMPIGTPLALSNMTVLNEPLGRQYNLDGNTQWDFYRDADRTDREMYMVPRVDPPPVMVVVVSPSRKGMRAKYDASLLGEIVPLDTTFWSRDGRFSYTYRTFPGIGLRLICYGTPKMNGRLVSYACNWCQEDNAIASCGDCQTVHYCSTDCQSQDWTQSHAQFCALKRGSRK